MAKTVYNAGQCPECKCYYLTYSEPVVEENTLVYKFKCDECGAEGVEEYNIVYRKSYTTN